MTTLGINIFPINTKITGKSFAVARNTINKSLNAKSSALTKFLLRQDLKYTKENYDKSITKMNKRYERYFKRKLCDSRVENQIGLILKEWGRKRSHCISLQEQKEDRLFSSVTSRGFKPKLDKNKEKLRIKNSCWSPQVNLNENLGIGNPSMLNTKYDKFLDSEIDSFLESTSEEAEGEEGRMENKTQTGFQAHKNEVKW